MATDKTGQAVLPIVVVAGAVWAPAGMFVRLSAAKIKLKLKVARPTTARLLGLLTCILESPETENVLQRRPDLSIQPRKLF